MVWPITHSDDKFCEWLVGILTMPALPTVVTFLVLVLLLTFGILFFGSAVLAASRIGCLRSQESVGGASSCLFGFDELKDFFQCHDLFLASQQVQLDVLVCQATGRRIACYVLRVVYISVTGGPRSSK